MRGMCAALTAVSVVGLLAACTTTPLPDGVPAIIVNPDEESRAELQAVVQTAMHGAPVMLAANALTETHILMIDRKPPRGIDAPPAMGRVLDAGETFELLLDGKQCVLKQQSTGLRWLLLDTDCRARAVAE